MSAAALQGCCTIGLSSVPCHSRRRATHRAGPLSVSAMEASKEGRPSDGKPLMPGDIVATVAGRTTTPWPSRASDLEVDRWLARNATNETAQNGDGFNERRFELVLRCLLQPTKTKRITHSPGDRDNLNTYLWPWQPSSQSLEPTLEGLSDERV